MPIDLHIHSTASDGVHSPTKIVDLANKYKLNAISITDHDTVSGINEAINASKNTNVEIIPGIEISCLYFNKDLHILGYFLDFESSSLKKELKKYDEIRIDRAGKMAELLQLQGFEITLSDIMEEAYPAAPGRAHVARLMLKRGHVANTQEAFEKYIKRGECCYVPKMGATAKQSIELIKNANGLTSLAHPYATDLNENEIESLRDAGIDAIEVFHPKHSESVTRGLKRLANRLGMLVTGGSDAHGYYRNNKAFKFASVDDKYLDALKAALG